MKNLGGWTENGDLFCKLPQEKYKSDSKEADS
jgi:hypothetical protein